MPLSNKILIVDHHPIFRKGLKAILEERNDFFGRVIEDNESNLALLMQSNKFDAVIFDISHMEINGFELIRKFKKSFPGLPVLAVSIHSEEEYGARAFRAGASGFIHKFKPANEFLDGLMEVLHGRKFFSSAVLNQVMDQEDIPDKYPSRKSLTNREFQIFCLLASGSKTSEIARKLSISLTTVSTHKAHIFEKLNLKNGAELVRYALRHKIISPN